MDVTLEMLLGRFGYAAIFIGAVLEGETVLLLAAVFVQQGVLDFKGMLLASALGAFVGDQFFFHLGRCKGSGFFRRYPAWQRKLDKAGRILERRRGAVVLGYRFIYGMRAVIPFLLGAGRCRVSMFALLSAVSAMAWAFVICSGGYYFGEAFEAVFEHSRTLQQRALAGVLCIAVVAAGIRWWMKRPSSPSSG